MNALKALNKLLAKFTDQQKFARKVSWRLLQDKLIDEKYYSYIRAAVFLDVLAYDVHRIERGMSQPTPLEIRRGFKWLFKEVKQG